MKSLYSHSSWKSLLILWALVIALVGSVFELAAAQGGGTPGKPGATVTNAGPPKAIFNLPHAPVEGKDPFYPRSVYPYIGTPKPPPSTPTNTAPVVIEVDLKLSGISGTREHPLAIVNGHTFEAGEEGELNTPNGKVHIRCLEIRPDGVTALVNGQRRELRMRGGL
jgi:hypothetical protein